MQVDKTKPALTPLLDNEEARNAVAEELQTKASVTTFLNRVADDFIQRDKNKTQKWAHRAERYRRYTMSDHNGRVNDNGDYEDFEGQTAREYYYDSKLNTYNATMMPQWMQSYPQIAGEPRHQNSIKNKRLVEMMEKEFTDWLQRPSFLLKKQREIEWNLLAHGNTYRYTYPNTESIVGYVDKPKTEEKTLTTERKGTWECPNCEAKGKVADLQGEECPQCEVKALSVSKDPEYNLKTPSEDVERIPILDIDYDVPDAKEVRVIWTSDNIHEALAVIWERKVPRCVLQEKFPEANLSVDNDGEDEQSEADEVPYQRIWLNPSVYHNFTPEQIETLIGAGEEIPVDAKVFKELYGNGLFYSRSNQTVLEMYPQATKECWTHCPNQLAGKGYGVGDWDMLEYQFQKNEMRTNRMNSALSDDTQPLMYDRNTYPQGEFPNFAGATVGIDLPSGKTLEDVATRVKAGNPPMNSISLDEQIDSDMQSRAGAFTTGNSSAPDMKAVQNTATGMQIQNNNVLERRRPLLKRMATHLDLEQFYQYWEIKQNYWSLAMFEQEYSDYPPEQIKWLKECDIRNDFNWFVVPNSFMPETKETKKENFLLWMQTPPGQAALADPEKLKEITRLSNEIFDAPELDEQNEEQAEAQLRLDEIIDAADKLEKDQIESTIGIRENGFISMDVIMLALSDAAKKCRIIDQEGEPFAGLPIDVLLDNHDEFIDVYQDFLRSGDGRRASDLAYASIKQIIVLHSQAAPLKKIYIQAQYAAVQEQIMKRQGEFQRGEALKDQEVQRDVELENQEEDFVRERIADQVITEQDAMNQAEGQAPPVETVM